MTSNTALDAINPHIYGLKAADACDVVIDQILISTKPADLIKSITYINEQIVHRDDHDRAMQALIHFATTGDREASAQIIKGYEYLAAHLHLGKAMHALQIRDEMLDGEQFPQPPVIDEMPAYPVRAENYQPAVTSITEILCESIQASNAPSAAIPAATCSII
ncbi:MAG: hypothetical protein F2677_03320 [Actinobacteria bacterium]|uniref:Unannotated protein n=1 Tax=freshwater metagenome TaxID=449393 RepID=A0A6J6Q4R7_9ZZZZ|nr:hypothetical protein [Actinomycetota bacterium]